MRDKALYVKFKEGLATGRFKTMCEIAQWVCRQPAPRFYIEPEKASVLVGRILAHVSLYNLNSGSRRLAWQLYRNYQAYLAEHPGIDLSRLRIMEILVEEPAPEFYIEPQRTRKILYGERKKAQQRWERSLAPR